MAACPGWGGGRDPCKEGSVELENFNFLNSVLKGDIKASGLGYGLCNNLPSFVYKHLPRSFRSTNVYRFLPKPKAVLSLIS